VSRRTRIGLAQLTGEPYDAERNRTRSVEVAARLFDGGADVVVLPELAVPGYGIDRDRLRATSEPLAGPTVEAWSALAGEHGGWVAGGFCERDGERLFNTAVVVGGDGVVLHYRKLHPFREEKHVFEPGDLGLAVADLPFGRVGACICYDLRFVETARILALEGAEVIFVPSAWLPGYDQRRWDARGLTPQAEGAIIQANLNQVYIVCASVAGRRDGLEFLGSSIVVGPQGDLLAGPLPGSSDDTALIEIDVDAVVDAQSRDELITPRADRRTDVYGLAVGDRVL
jgi:predicted amidohydrolase